LHDIVTSWTIEAHELPDEREHTSREGKAILICGGKPMNQERDYERLRRENEELKRALEEAQKREIESINTQLAASYEREDRLQATLEVASERENQLWRMLEHLTMRQPAPAPEPIQTSPPAEAPRDWDAPAMTVREQVLQYFKTNPGAHSVDAVKAAVGTSGSVKDVLTKLYQKGEIRRVARGIYEGARPASAPPQRQNPSEPPPDTLLGRVLAFVRDAKGKRVRTWQVKNGLGLEQPPTRELSKLVKRQLIRRVAPSVYIADPPPDTAISSNGEKPEQTVAEGVKDGY
jgi:hypothetical protein